jgi:hypothetical protein
MLLQISRRFAAARCNRVVSCAHACLCAWKAVTAHATTRNCLTTALHQRCQRRALAVYLNRWSLHVPMQRSRCASRRRALVYMRSWYTARVWRALIAGVAARRRKARLLAAASQMYRGSIISHVWSALRCYARNQLQSRSERELADAHVRRYANCLTVF